MNEGDQFQQLFLGPLVAPDASLHSWSDEPLDARCDRSADQYTRQPHHQLAS